MTKKEGIHGNYTNNLTRPGPDSGFNLPRRTIIRLCMLYFIGLAWTLVSVNSLNPIEGFLGWSLMYVLIISKLWVTVVALIAILFVIRTLSVF